VPEEDCENIEILEAKTDRGEKICETCIVLTKRAIQEVILRSFNSIRKDKK
jgi:hypothetical protein